MAEKAVGQRAEGQRAIKSLSEEKEVETGMPEGKNAEEGYAQQGSDGSGGGSRLGIATYNHERLTVCNILLASNPASQ